MADDKSVTSGEGGDPIAAEPKEEGKKPDVVAPVTPSKATTVDDSQDLTGLKKNRDDILAEKKSLQDKYDKLIEANEKRDNEALVEQNRFKDLYEKSETKIKDLKTSHKAEIEKLKTEHESSTNKFKSELEKIQKLNTFNSLAAQHGFNIEYSNYHIEDPGLEWKSNDNGGITLSNPDDFFKSLKEKKPALFGGQPTVKTDATKTTPLGNKGHLYSPEEIRSMPIEKYKKLRDEAGGVDAMESQIKYGDGK